MGTQRASVTLPTDLLQQIDKLVGPRGRSAFLEETARAEIKRRELASFLRSEMPAWNDEDHPELSNGTGNWVRSLRQEAEVRSAEIQARWHDE